MKHLTTIALLLALAGCTPHAATGKTSQQIQDEVQSIANKCSPAGKVKFDLVGTQQLHVIADPSATYAEVDCFLEGIKPYHFNLGFVGNEAR